MTQSVWPQCIARLENELNEQQFNTWILPLQAQEDAGHLTLFAPNRFVCDWVKDHFFDRINEILIDIDPQQTRSLHLGIGGDLVSPPKAVQPRPPTTPSSQASAPIALKPQIEIQHHEPYTNHLNSEHSFENFVEGKSNQLAKAASMQVAENKQGSFNHNPMYIYGSTGLGKTHLMHAIGNKIKALNPEAKVVCLNSEHFVNNMIKALQHNSMAEFSRYYRSVDALLIDDIQFFANKDRSQEEFFHTFNSLMDNRHQVILTCDRYPKEVEGLEDRLKSRFGWGLTVAIEPPELETRVAILQKKASDNQFELPSEVAFFIAKRIRSNVRELEGALKRVMANASITGRAITLDFAKEALRDLLALQQKLVTIANIQKTVAEYFNIRTSDMLSASRSRSVTRPRQIAMALAKELTHHSLPEIGNAFGGRDHTTVLHACKKIRELRDSDQIIDEDYKNLLRTLSS